MIARAGTCPKCSGTNTAVNVVERDGHFEAWCSCYGCGYEDSRYRGDDASLVADVASGAFSTVYVDDGAPVEGLPTVQQLADDISRLIKVVCVMNKDCMSCTMHRSDSPSSAIDGEGWFQSVSRLGLRCCDQDPSECAKTLRKAFPSLADEF